jgi:hypothetical protein
MPITSTTSASAGWLGERTTGGTGRTRKRCASRARSASGSESRYARATECTVSTRVTPGSGTMRSDVDLDRLDAGEAPRLVDLPHGHVAAADPLVISVALGRQAHAADRQARADHAGGGGVRR